MACSKHDGKNIYANKKDGVVRCANCDQPISVTANLSAKDKEKLLKGKPKRKK